MMRTAAKVGSGNATGETMATQKAIDRAMRISAAMRKLAAELKFSGKTSDIDRALYRVSSIHAALLCWDDPKHVKTAVRRMGRNLPQVWRSVCLPCEAARAQLGRELEVAALLAEMDRSAELLAEGLPYEAGIVLTRCIRWLPPSAPHGADTPWFEVLALIIAGDRAQARTVMLRERGKFANEYRVKNEAHGLHFHQRSFADDSAAAARLTLSSLMRTANAISSSSEQSGGGQPSGNAMGSAAR